MEHLNLETLARLVDEAPTAEEQSHLAMCEECVIELDAMREQSLSLGSLPDVRPPKGDWAVLEARMVSEGLVRSSRGLSRLAMTPGWMKAAAAAVLFLGGTGLGMQMAQSPVLGGNGVASAAGGPFSLASTTVSTVDEAAAAVRLAERQYVDALIQYNQLSSDQDPGSVQYDSDRLAALEYLVAGAQAGLEQAPADPFFNGLHASLLAERQSARQATLRRASTGNGWF